MPVATLTKEITLPPEQAFVVYAVSLCLFFAGIHVYRKTIRSVGTRGGRVRSDLFGLADIFVAGILVVLMVLALAMYWMFSSAALGKAALQMISIIMFLSLPVIMALLVARGLSLPTLFGFHHVGFARALGIGAGFVVVLLPLFMLVTFAAYRFLDGQAEQQEVVTTFREAAKTGKHQVIWQVVIGAVIVAPLAEEFLFRGYFYPVAKRIVGSVPAAVGISLLFAAVHHNALGMPGLTLLALALTLAYEWSGSILVPIFMHAWFNAISLFAMWWAAREGMMQ